MNSNFKRALEKHVKQTPLNQELSPGTTPRRYEPKGGVQKHNARIHRESEIADQKGLDFSFRKPPKPKGRANYVQCDSCGYITSGTTATVGIVCPECKQFSTVTEVTDDE